MKHNVLAIVVLLSLLVISLGLACPVMAQDPSTPVEAGIDWSNALQVVLEGMLAAALPIIVGFGVSWVKAKTTEILQGMDEQARWAVADVPSPSGLYARSDPTQKGPTLALCSG